jgi:hypothetical protein
MDSQWLVELYGPTSYKPVQEDGQGKGQKVGHERKEIVPTIPVGYPLAVGAWLMLQNNTLLLVLLEYRYTR